MTNTLEQRRIERLNIKLNKLQDELGKALDNSITSDIDKLLDEIRALEAEKKENHKRTELERVNRQHKEKREFLKEALKVEFPNEDLRTNEGSLHKTKIKKHPSFQAFVNKYPYASFEFCNQTNKYHIIKKGGETYQILKPSYIGSEVNYTTFESFETCCKWNHFQIKPMTFKQFQKVETAILKEGEKLKKTIKEHEERIKKLNAYFLECNNLIKKSQERAYSYYSI
jgi:hypothetical protein